MQTWTDELQTMRRAYADIVGGEAPWVALGNFTNDFFDEPEERVALIADPLDIDSGMAVTNTFRSWAVFCAASVEYLCSIYQLPLPGWIYEPTYTPLAQPWYHVPPMAPQDAQTRIRERLEAETPDVFKQRNIFCGNRVYLNKREEAEKLRRLLSA